MLGFPAEGWQVIFQQRPASLAGCCLQHPSQRDRTVVQQHRSRAGPETWKCRSVWQGRRGLWFLGGSNSGSRLPLSALSKHCPEDGEGRSGPGLWRWLQGWSCSGRVLHPTGRVSVVSGNAGCSPARDITYWRGGDGRGCTHTGRGHGCPRSPCWQVFTLLLSRGRQPSWGCCGKGCVLGAGCHGAQGEGALLPSHRAAGRHVRMGSIWQVIQCQMGICFHFPGPRWARAAPTHAGGQRSAVWPDPHGGQPRSLRWEHGTGGPGRVLVARLASLVQPCRNALQSAGSSARAPVQRAVQGLCTHGAG